MLPSTLISRLVAAALFAQFGCARAMTTEPNIPPAAPRVSPIAAQARLPIVEREKALGREVLKRGIALSSLESAHSWQPPTAQPRRVDLGPVAQLGELRLPAGTLVYHFGDSFAGALGPPLNHELAKSQVRGILHYETSSYITTWASRDIERLVANANPDLVIITLGANEIELTNPAQRAPAIRRLVAQLRGRPCVWIAPPLWEQDSGLLSVVQDNCAPCAYLDSTAQVTDLPRKKDGIHPSKPGQEAWAKVVAEWLAQHRSPTPGRPWNLLSEY